MNYIWFDLLSNVIDLVIAVKSLANKPSKIALSDAKERVHSAVIPAGPTVAFEHSKSVAYQKLLVIE